jgi:ABC-type methionine transport system ATPase subunit
MENPNDPKLMLQFLRWFRFIIFYPRKIPTLETPMEDRRVRLLYPPTQVNVPVIYQLIKQFDITINILGAKINPDEGWVDLQVSGNGAALNKAVAWLNSQGIEVKDLE